MRRSISVAVWLLLGGCAGAAHDLPNWAPIEPSEYPVELRAVVFSEGMSITPTSGVAIPRGNWSVAFPASGTPTAGLSAEGHLHVSPLRCTDPSVGAQPCYLTLRHRRGELPFCTVVVGLLPGEAGSSSEFILACPDLRPLP